MKPKAMILDIDGVILNTDFIFQEINELGLKGNDIWEYFYQHCNSDRVQLMQGIEKFIWAVDEFNIIISTARSEKVRLQTSQKLTKHRILVDKMYMRNIDDLNPASCVKREHLERIMKNYDIIAFIDDDLTNCQMAKELGILALRRV